MSEFKPYKIEITVDSRLTEEILFTIGGFNLTIPDLIRNCISDDDARTLKGGSKSVNVHNEAMKMMDVLRETIEPVRKNGIDG